MCACVCVDMQKVGLLQLNCSNHGAQACVCPADRVCVSWYTTLAHVCELRCLLLGRAGGGEGCSGDSGGFPGQAPTLPDSIR